ncbi:uncharacterized protein LOC115628432 [Scaptodrosophila lebanonensis]|uniref:Uncharacterized protein LOC115628432 n=1 Tax=Drosophila lebanonensis TaxID=7225 RepID=A0A6J2TXS4_DROLE|nr:uncharacterized protein LOC115628432 [Scaptodrosophila lebanonensis]
MWPSSDRGSSRALEMPTSQHNAGGSSQQETLADIEHISTIAGSLASIGSLSHTQMRYGTNDAGYDTEHTSLNSDFDEAELRRELLRDKWKLLFDMFDPEGFGEISTDEFLVALKSKEFLSQVPMNKRELLLERTKKAQLPTGPGYVTFQDFVNVLARDKSFYGSTHVRRRPTAGRLEMRRRCRRRGANVLSVMTTGGSMLSLFVIEEASAEDLRICCPAGDSS